MQKFPANAALGSTWAAAATIALRLPPAKTDTVTDDQDSPPPRPPLSPGRQFALQAAAAFLVLSALWPYYGFVGNTYNWPLATVLIGITASIFSRLAGQPWWWRLIHLFFAPLAWLILQVDLDPGWFLFGFIALALFYRGVIVERVPLYLSGVSAIDVVAETIEQRHSRHFIDLGAGIGSLVVPLAKAFPECHFTGVEYSPMSWLIGWLRTRGMANVDWRYANLWSAPLGNFDVAYAFLSPAPMPELARKFDAEMAPGGLLISNSFFIPDREASLEKPAGGMTIFFYEKPAA